MDSRKQTFIDTHYRGVVRGAIETQFTSHLMVGACKENNIRPPDSALFCPSPLLCLVLNDHTDEPAVHVYARGPLSVSVSQLHPSLSSSAAPCIEALALTIYRVERIPLYRIVQFAFKHFNYLNILLSYQYDTCHHCLIDYMITFYDRDF